MNIVSHGFRATASEAELEDTRARLQAALDVLLPEYKHDPLMLFIDKISGEIETLDIDIAGLRREDRIAEENAKYREDRPNA